MPEDAVLYETRGALAFVTLNRPQRLNAIDGTLIAGLEEAVARANREPEVRVIVLRGAGRAFCADFRMMARNVQACMSLWHSPKPVIAQVHGWCVGGGTDLALCSDLIFMAEDARLGYPPSRVWGTPTTCMWVYRLCLEHAKRLMLTGQAGHGGAA